MRLLIGSLLSGSVGERNREGEAGAATLKGLAWRKRQWRGRGVQTKRAQVRGGGLIYTSERERERERESCQKDRYT